MNKDISQDESKKSSTNDPEHLYHKPFAEALKDYFAETKDSE